MHRMSWRALRRSARPLAPPRSGLLRLLAVAGLVASLGIPPGEAMAATRDKAVSAKKARGETAARHAARTKPGPERLAKAPPARLFKLAHLESGAAATVAGYTPMPPAEAYAGDRIESVPPPARPASARDPVAGMPTVSSRTVLVYDEASGRPLYSRDDGQSQPIASITKLMTAMVVLDARLPMEERLTITWDDVDHLRGSSSRVPVGAELSREELLRLALMSSENRAAAALGRNYPGGSSAFVRAMNAKAAALGMSQSRFEDSTGLHGGNRASAMDLVRMVQAANDYPQIRSFTTTGSHLAELGRKHVEFRNTNALVRSPEWDIGVSKTGYIREAGRCLVMHARIAARPVVIVLLDGDGKYTRLGDANRIKHWLEGRWRGDVLASNG